MNDRERSLLSVSSSPIKSPLRKVGRHATSSNPRSRSNTANMETEMEKLQILEELRKIREGQERMQLNQRTILERISEVEKDISGLKEDVQSLKIDQSASGQKIDSLGESVSHLKFELNRLEQYSRKSSIRVYGVTETDGERVGEKVIEKIKEEIDADIDAKEIDVVHRVGKKSQDKTRGILVKFVSHKTKEKIMRKKKSAKNIRISEDLASGTRVMLNKIHTEKQNVNIEKAWTIDGRIKYKFRDSDAILEIRSSDDFKKLIGQDNMEH